MVARPQPAGRAKTLQLAAPERLSQWVAKHCVFRALDVLLQVLKDASNAHQGRLTHGSPAREAGESTLTDWVVHAIRQTAHANKPEFRRLPTA